MQLFGSPDFVRDPYAVYRLAREQDPVHWCEPWGAWVVTRHADVTEVLRRVDDFSSAGYELELLGPEGPLGRGRHIRRSAGTTPRRSSRRPIRRSTPACGGSW